MPLDPDIAMLITEIDANVSHAQSIVHGLTAAQFEWSPAADRWSIGQCIAHLNSTNKDNVSAITEGVAKGRAKGLTGEGPFHYGFLMRRLIASQEPPATRKSKAPKNLLPPPKLDMEATVAEYWRIAVELKRLAREASGLHLSKVKLRLPGLPPVPRAIVRVPLGGWMAFATTHDRRHLWQAEQVRNDPGFPA